MHGNVVLPTAFPTSGKSTTNPITYSHGILEPLKQRSKVQQQKRLKQRVAFGRTTAASEELTGYVKLLSYGDKTSMQQHKNHTQREDRGIQKLVEAKNLKELTLLVTTLRDENSFLKLNKRTLDRELEAMKEQYVEVCSELTDYNRRNNLLASELAQIEKTLDAEQDARDLVVTQAREMVLARDQIQNKIRALETALQEARVVNKELEAKVNHEKNHRLVLDSEKHALKKAMAELKGEQSLLLHQHNEAREEVKKIHEKWKLAQTIVSQLQETKDTFEQSHKDALTDIKSNLTAVELEHRECDGRSTRQLKRIEELERQVLEGAQKLNRSDQARSVAEAQARSAEARVAALEAELNEHRV